MTKEEQRADILNMLRDHKINVNDALLMLNRLDEENSPVGEGITTPKEKPQKSYQTMIEDIIDQVISGMNMERVYRIMENMEWTYAGGPATREQILNCIKDNIRRAIGQLVNVYTNDIDTFAITGTGGFLCRAWIDDNDPDNIQVELGFQPVTGYGEYPLSELVDAKMREG